MIAEYRRHLFGIADSDNDVAPSARDVPEDARDEAAAQAQETSEAERGMID